MLYSLSDELKNNILDMAKVVEHNLDGSVKFEEYIVLPDYVEKIIIRFSLAKDEDKSLKELDEIESKIRHILGSDYWGNLLGDSYKKFGFDSSKMSDSLKNIDSIVNDKIIHYKDNSYSQYINNDKKLIRNLLNLTPQQKIWEIHPPNENESDALIL